jgi:hypothetical protein
MAEFSARDLMLITAMVQAALEHIAAERRQRRMMPQRHSEYARQPNDAYWTPQWCFDLLHAAESLNVVMEAAPREPHSFDFFMQNTWVGDVVTNPPFNRA